MSVRRFHRQWYPGPSLAGAILPFSAHLSGRNAVDGDPDVADLAARGCNRTSFVQGDHGQGAVHLSRKLDSEPPRKKVDGRFGDLTVDQCPPYGFSGSRGAMLNSINAASESPSLPVSSRRSTSPPTERRRTVPASVLPPRMTSITRP